MAAAASVVDARSEVRERRVAHPKEAVTCLTEGEDCLETKLRRTLLPNPRKVKRPLIAVAACSSFHLAEMDTTTL